MRVKEIMTQNPTCCTPEQTIQDAARLMVNYDCGSIPVVQDRPSMRLIGIITDRDIACRAVAKGKPSGTPIRDCMSSPVATVTPDTELERCCEIMEENQIRRIPVVDAQGACCGIVTQAHVAKVGSEKQASRVVKGISQKTKEPSRMAAVAG